MTLRQLCLCMQPFSPGQNTLHHVTGTALPQQITYAQSESVSREQCLFPLKYTSVGIGAVRDAERGTRCAQISIADVIATLSDSNPKLTHL